MWVFRNEAMEDAQVGEVDCVCVCGDRHNSYIDSGCGWIDQSKKDDQA